MSGFSGLSNQARERNLRAPLPLLSAVILFFLAAPPKRMEGLLNAGSSTLEAHLNASAQKIIQLIPAGSLRSGNLPAGADGLTLRADRKRATGYQKQWRESG